MADKIVLMRNGAIAQAGTPDDLYDRPNSRYVAEFIGSPGINCLNGQIAMENGAVVFRDANIDIPLPAGFAAHAGRRVTCGIRPTDVTIAPSGPITGKMLILEKTGAEVVLHLDVAGDEFVVVAPRDTRVRAGETLSLAVAASKIHIFDAGTGDRIDA